MALLCSHCHLAPEEHYPLHISLALHTPPHCPNTSSFSMMSLGTIFRDCEMSNTYWAGVFKGVPTCSEQPWLVTCEECACPVFDLTRHQHRNIHIRQPDRQHITISSLRTHGLFKRILDRLAIVIICVAPHYVRTGVLLALHKLTGTSDPHHQAYLFLNTPALR